jgi:hypothetical protein
VAAVVLACFAATVAPRPAGALRPRSGTPSLQMGHSTAETRVGAAASSSSRVRVAQAIRGSLMVAVWVQEEQQGRQQGTA